MRFSILLLAAGVISRETCMLCTAITVFLLFFLQYMRTQPLEFFYSKKNALMKEFVEKSNITKLAFSPYIFAPTPGIQGLLYLLTDFICRTYYPEEKPFERETVELPDGGTLGIDWDGPIPSKTGSKCPILIIFPGLAGSSDNLYSLSVLRAARE